MVAPHPPDSSFFDLVTWLELHQFDRTSWSLAVLHEDPKYQLVRADAALAQIHKWVSSPIGKYIGENKRTAEAREARTKAFFRTHSAVMDSLFHELRLIGGQLGEFIDTEGLLPPIGLATWNGGTTLLVSGVATNIFLPAESQVSDRAATIASRVFLPTLKDLALANWPPEITSIGIAILYGSVDATERFEPRKAEMVAYIVSRSDAKRYLEGQDTDSDLIERAAVFISDRTMVTGVRRIGLTLQRASAAVTLDTNEGTQTDVPRYDVQAYCAKVSNSAGGSYQIEASCRKQEAESQKRLTSLRDVDSRILRYCRTTADRTAQSYWFLTTCIENELKAKSELK